MPRDDEPVEVTVIRLTITGKVVRGNRNAWASRSAEIQLTVVVATSVR